MTPPLTQEQSIYLTQHPELLRDIDPTLEAIHYLFARLAFKTLDPDTIAMKDKAIKLAPRDESVIIRGESGTGKELIAGILQHQRKGNFVAVNSTAVTETLFESELFGHVRGAFTGASESRAGLISHANDGCIFLDEVGDLPLSLQPKLLRVIQTRQFRLVGSNTYQPVKCRIIAATHMNLEQMVKDGKFRLDLFQRLATFQLTIKPLRDRWETDGPIHVTDSRLLEILSEQHKNNKESFLPGNMRELENIILRYKVLGEL